MKSILERTHVSRCTKANYPLALTAWCPECGVLPGVRCVSWAGNERPTPHALRVLRAEKIERRTLKSPLMPGEPTGPAPVAEQLGLVGYEPEVTRGA